MAQRCCMYKRGEIYFTICTSGTDCPPMPDAENVTWWQVDDCRECRVPAGYPVSAPPAPAPPKQPTATPPRLPVEVDCPGTTEIEVFDTYQEAKKWWEGSKCKTTSKCPNQKACQKMGMALEKTIKGVTFGVAIVTCQCPKSS